MEKLKKAKALLDEAAIPGTSDFLYFCPRCLSMYSHLEHEVVRHAIECDGQPKDFKWE